MSRSILIPEDCEQLLIFSFRDDRWFSLVQIDPEGFIVKRCSFPLEYGANYICVCDLRDKCCGLMWEDELNEHIQYRVIPSKYRNLYVLAPKGAPRFDEWRQKRKAALEDIRDRLPWPDVTYDPPNLLELTATYLFVNGVGRREVAAVQPGLVWAMFEVVRGTVKMIEPERRDEVPMCPYSYHTWEKYVADYERSERST